MGETYPWRRPKGRVLFVGSCYYNTWYLSRALRERGWIADTFSDAGDGADSYLHGMDFRMRGISGLDDYTPEMQAYFRGFSADYLRRVPRERADVRPQPPAGGLIRSLAKRALGWWASRARTIRDLSLPDLTAQLLREQEPRRLLAALEEFLARVQSRPGDQILPLHQVPRRYDVIHFCGINNLRFLYFLNGYLFGCMPVGWDIDVLKRLGKKIVYSHTGCLDGVSQSAFRKWGPYPVCGICKWRDVPEVCSDERNLRWGALRNHLADYQILLGGNRVDYNDDPRVHEVPEFYCLDPEFWRPDLPVPEAHRLRVSPKLVKIYHAVGHYDQRTRDGKENIKTTHLIVPAVERLKAEGHPVELVFCTNVPNQDVRYYQVQSDIVVDMLTFGFFGANIREAMMLGKTAVCFLRPEWLQSMRGEIPAYVNELPVVSATPDTIHQVLLDLVKNPARRAELGRRGRQFALKWHSSAVAGRRFDKIYSSLLRGTDPVRRCA
jgi:glycosyltransferase involved in cell wall biosynthesis